MSDTQTYKNRNITVHRTSGDFCKGRPICAVQVLIEPGILSPEFDILVGIGDIEPMAKADAFQRARALIDYNEPH